MSETSVGAPDIASAFVAAAARLGDSPALILGDTVVSFKALAAEVELVAHGFRRAGLGTGDRVAVLVPPSREFYSLFFGLLRAGLTPVFVDPGIGFKNLGTCLQEAAPEAFIGSPKAHLARLLGRWAPNTRLSVVVGGYWPGTGRLEDLLALGKGANLALPALKPDARAAILFTSGSTGVSKGAVYLHSTFAAQVAQLRELFDIKEGEVSVPTFPLFGLFDAALGLTCVIPDMDFTRPGFVDPRAIIAPLQKHKASQLFGSPAMLDRVGRYGARCGIALPHLKRVLSAGAPVPAKVLERFSSMLAPGTPIHTPYGATEALPVALTDSREILKETATEAGKGNGTCVGKPVPGIEVKIIKIEDGPIKQWSDDLLVPVGHVGEITVKGPVVTREYFRRPEAMAQAKIGDGNGFRHRMGDLGRIDSQGRLWFYGRKTQRVRSANGDMHTVAVENIFDAHPAVKRSALVGVGEPGAQRPVLCVERDEDVSLSESELRDELLAFGAKHETSRIVTTILFHPRLPVDIRHNAKIFREKLVPWAAERLR